MNEISEKIVKTGKISYTLFFRDFVHCDVACYFPAFDALVVHGGLNTKHINEHDNMLLTTKQNEVNPDLVVLNYLLRLWPWVISRIQCFKAGPGDLKVV